MFESKYSKLLTVLLIIGIIVIIGVLIYLAMTMINNNNLMEETGNAAEQFQNKVSKPEENVEENNSVVTNSVAPDLEVQNVVVDGNTSSQGNETYYKGELVVGTIEIPAINLKSVVLNEINERTIEIAVGIYDGPGLNQVGNTTIAGHNYRDGRFFSNNKQLKEDDKIYITDSTGKKVTYYIYKTYITSPEDSSHLERDTQGKREITLVTCTDDAKSRLIILAKER